MGYRKDGTEFWHDVNVGPVHDDDGQLKYLVWVIADATDRKHYETALVAAKETAEQANRMKTEFLAAMSHELRTPLNAIIGFAEMMKEGLFGPLGSPKYEEYAGGIHRSGVHLHDVIMDILEMAKIESGKFELCVEEIDVGGAVDACLRMVHERAVDANIEITVRVPENLPNFHADERVFRQIVLNLLSNAVKFTPEGGKITVTAWIDDSQDLRIDVSDTGIGMAEEDIPKAFEPFCQVDSALSRKYEGTGLGLPLVKNFVEMHGGTIATDSIIGVGTNMKLLFPAQRLVRRAA